MTLLHENETSKERLERIGRTQLMIPYSTSGKAKLQSVLYPTQEYYERSIMDITGIEPTDPDGTGYEFPETESEV